MNVREGRVEEHLKRTAAWWKWQIFIRRTATLASLSCGALLLVGGGMTLGWFDSLVWAGAWIALVVLVSLFAWMVVGVLIAESSQDVSWLAAVLEKSYNPLMDRLNALVYLRKEVSGKNRQYADVIEHQTIDILARAPARCPFSWRRTLAHVGISTAILAATVAFYLWMRPWTHVLAAASARSGAAHDGSGFENTLLEIPDLTKATDDRESEQPAAWGEVRITQPGHDVGATRLEVVPLEIEVAANKTLSQVRWISGRNALPQVVHELPPPDEQSYALYEPLIVPEDHQAGRADVIAYYAEAKSDSKVYASDLFFVDVIPLRAEIDHMPGGRNGIASRVLGHVSSVIQWQQDVLRKVHRLSDDMERVSGDERGIWNTLAEDIAQVEATIRHLTAQFSAAFAPARVERIVQSLEQARAALLKSEAPLRERRRDATMHQCWTALGHLIAARKQVYALIRDHPHEFLDQQRPLQQSGKVSDAVRAPQQAPRDGRMLEKIQQRLEVAEHARQALRDIAREQQRVEHLAHTHSPSGFPEVAQDQDRLVQALDDAMEKWPETLDAVQPRTDAARRQMQTASRALQLKKSHAPEETSRAAERMDALTREMEDVLDRLNTDRGLPEDDAAQLARTRARRNAERLANMQSRRQELEDAREFIRDALGKERNIEREANPRNQKNLRQLADEQHQLTRSVENFLDEKPIFRHLPSLCSRATSAMRATEQALKNGRKEARERAGNAADTLQALDNALEKEQRASDLPEAYTLKRMLENEIQQLKQLEQRPDQAPPGQCRKTGGRCKSIVNQLKNVAARGASDGRLGPALHETLRDENADRISAQCDKLAGAPSPDAIKQAAQDLRQELETVQRAFDDSVPQTLARRSRSAPSRAGNSQAVMRALQQFRSGTLRRATGRELDAEENMLLQFDAFDNLIEGIRGTYGSNENVMPIVEQLRRDLRQPDYRIDMATLAALLEHVRQVSANGMDQKDSAEQKPLVNVDPADFPAPYRDAIQRYFQKLSERP